MSAADRIREALAKMTPLLEALPDALEPAMRKATDDLYYRLMTTVEDYLKSNAEWNIQEEINASERESQCLRAERDALAAERDALAEEVARLREGIGRLRWDMSARQAALAERVYKDGHSAGWADNQYGKDVQHIAASKEWSLYVSDGAFAKSIEAAHALAQSTTKGEQQ